MSHVSIRTLRSADLERVVDIWNRALLRDPTNLGRFVTWLFGDPDYWPGDDSGFFVAERGGAVVGFARAIIRRWPNDRVGIEPERGWIPVLAVDPAHQRQRIGTTLLDRALTYLRAAGRKECWVCGNTGSAPGYVFPGVDKDLYAGALALFQKHGFTIDHEPVSMSREVVDFDVEQFHEQAWRTGQDIRVQPLELDRVQQFLDFMATAFPGDWNMAARAKLRAGALHEVLIALHGETIVGYCQWEGEHFGPFGVTAQVRSQGIGAKLFVEAVRRIRAADGRTVWFNWADEAAARFYGRYGLRPQRHFAILRAAL